MSSVLARPVSGADGAGDFDFFIGSWQVHHRRLRKRLNGSQEWDVFPGTATAWKILGGFGNIDDHLLELPAGAYRAASLRSYDATKRIWSIWWLDGRAPDRLDVPVVGGFQNGGGTFYADELFEGRPIRVRFNWTETNSARPHWEQAFSTDGGRTWETNWTMDFVRTT